MTLSIGDKLTSQTISASQNENANLTDYIGKKLVIYFYPKDNTPGCTQQGQDFRDHFQAFTKAQCQILGVSKDSLKTHANFINKFDFPFALLSDQDEHICNLFDIIKEKTCMDVNTWELNAVPFCLIHRASSPKNGAKLD